MKKFAVLAIVLSTFLAGCSDEDVPPERGSNDGGAETFSTDEGLASGVEAEPQFIEIPFSWNGSLNQSVDIDWTVQLSPMGQPCAYTVLLAEARAISAFMTWQDKVSLPQGRFSAEELILSVMTRDRAKASPCGSDDWRLANTSEVSRKGELFPPLKLQAVWPKPDPSRELVLVVYPSPVLGSPSGESINAVWDEQEFYVDALLFLELASSAET